MISAFLKSLAVRRQADCWSNSLRSSPLDIDHTLIPSKESPKPLKRLILCHNDFGDKGAAPLFDLLYEDVGLSALDLQFTKITEYSGKRAIEALKVNRDLVILDLRNNTICNHII